MVFPFWFIYNQGQLWFDISKGVTMRGAKAVINSTCHPCPVVDIKKVEHRGNTLASSRRSSYPVQWSSMTKVVQLNELVVWLPGVR